MSATLEKPEIVYQDFWDCWTINAGYYGERKPGLCWSIEIIKPSTEEAAKELLALAPKITENLRGREQGKITGILALVMPQPKDDYRLRADKTATGWKISEYDFSKWSFEIAS